MANDSYSWSDVRGVRVYRLPGPEHLGWWAVAAMLVSILLHVIVFFALDHIKIALGIERPQEISTGAMNVRQVEVPPLDDTEELPPQESTIEVNDAAALLEEIDILEQLPVDQEIDIRPDALEPQYALQLTDPIAMEGDPEAMALEMSSGMEIQADLPELGRMEEAFPPAAIGQITVDPGAAQVDDLNLDTFTEELLKRGAEGQVEAGALEGITSLEDMIGLPANLLVGKKTLLPSDLLFEFNSDELRDSAKIGLMKLGLLIDLNPGLHCWIEGHTDLVGGDEFNLKLSQRRAQAVKSYLVNSMRMDPSRIHAQGYGRSKPLVTEGGAEEQAPNRRVEIRMRKSPPPDQPVLVTPRVAPAVTEDPPPPKAVLVRPLRTPTMEEIAPPRALPVEDSQAVEDPPAAPRAVPVEEPPPRALPVEE